MDKKTIPVKDIKKVSSAFQLLHGEHTMEIYGTFIHPSGDPVEYSNWETLKGFGRLNVIADVDDEANVKMKPSPYSVDAPMLRIETTNVPFVKVVFELERE